MGREDKVSLKSLFSERVSQVASTGVSMGLEPQIGITHEMRNEIVEEFVVVRRTKVMLNQTESAGSKRDE
jgi:hypothetical protein